MELRTKIASQFPFLFGILYSLYRYGEFAPLNCLLMFVSLLFFDMTTTAINNYVDFQKSEDPSYRQFENPIGTGSLSLALVRLVIALMLMVAVTAGVLLALRTGPVLLAGGMISFAAGILYTAGPVPISRLPLGELFSGLFMGFLIPFLTVYINHGDIFPVALNGSILELTVPLGEWGGLFLVSLPFIFTISNLMLANNICDLEQDMGHNRYLLPFFLGIPRSLLLFRVSYYLIFPAITTAVILRILPLLSLASLLCFIPVNRNLGRFLEKQDKGSTFVLSARNLTLVSLFYLIPPGLAVLWKLLN
ncbi:MAG: 1,4-dihydroxy-2-naphthoate polyprenyltransferase [Spirochaetales bacterium]|nr:1,4-dihydroxy-2-naphthoate polyprenyltransferase [Spirochaetales bacterium]